ncbi:SCO family protein [Roseateles sp.]|uniref:SCO family protein n=1 Tax=Roseateles sp. TaxID=1971397 RepID=UPI003D0CF4A2
MTLTVHSLPTSQGLAEAQRKRGGRLRMLMVLAACAAPVLASYFTFYVVQPSGRAYADLIVPTVDIPSTLHLQDLQGKPVTADSLKGQWLLTLVQEGSCDEACERRFFLQRQLREMLGKERDKVDKLWLLPEDSPLPRPELLKALNQGVGVTILRAPRAELQAWLKPAEGQTLLDHVFLVDPMGRWMLRAPPQPDPSKLKADLSRLLKANAGWDKEGR